MNIPTNWTFENDEVAANFDKHVREQLPWYDLLTDLIVMVAKHYLPKGGRAYDIGASTGNLGVEMTDTIRARNIEWIGIESAPQMIKHYRADGTLEICDALKYDYKPFDLAVCFLSIMFFPKDRRYDWLVKLLEKAKYGGAIIIVDKEEPRGGILSTALHRFILSSKARTTAPEQIIEKEFSLGGIQRPLSRDFMRMFGATEIFRCGDFAAWVIEKNWR